MGFLDSIFTGLGFGFGSGIGHKIAEEAIDTVGDMISGKKDGTEQLSQTPPARTAPLPVPPGFTPAIATSVRFCGDCGTPNDRTDKFCSECGSSLA